MHVKARKVSLQFTNKWNQTLKVLAAWTINLNSYKYIFLKMFENTIISFIIYMIIGNIGQLVEVMQKQFSVKL